MLRNLPPGLRKTCLRAFDEFNRGTSKEAAVVRDLDKLEMVIQASAYERDGVSRDLLDEFWKTADARIKTKEGRELLRSASSRRPRHSTP